MNDDQLQEALSSLPRERAGLGFTAGVLRRIEAPGPRFLAAPWSRWAAAAAAVLVLTLGLGWREWRHRQSAERLRVLLAEKHELEAEIEALRRLAAEASPLVYLGSEDRVDLVLDLERFRRRGGFGSNLSAFELPDPDPRAVSARRAVGRQGEPTARPLRVVY